jgi:hypothetical protein
MRKFQLLLLLAIVVALASCSSAKEATDVWINKEKIQGKKYHHLFLIVMTADIEVRAKLENDLSAAAKARGYEAVKSIEVMPSTLKDPRLPTKEEIVSAIAKSGCDAVFIASLLNKDEDMKFSKGSTTYTQNNYFSYTSYYGYYSTWYPSVHKADYYNLEKKYVIHSNIFDVATEEVMYSVKSEVFNPSNLQGFSTGYISTLLKQLEKAGLLKK